MKRKMMRKISFLLALCMLFTTILSGCAPESKQVALFSEDDANFIIIRSVDANEEVISIASDLRQRIIDKLDIQIPYKPDTVKHQEGQIEVNIGLTNREATKTIYDEILAANANNGMDWAIQMEGEYIYIVGATDEALQVAVHTFYGNFCRDVKSTIKSDFKYVYHYENEENKFEMNGTKDLSQYCFVTPQYNMSYLIGKEVMELQSAIMTATGSNVVEKIDSEKETEYEIIVGNTKRAGTPKCDSEDEYRIKMKDKKLYICGGSDAATALAVKEVARMVNEGKPIDSKTDVTGSYAKTMKKYENYYSLTFADEFDTFDQSIWTAEKGNFTNQGLGSDKPTAFADGSDMIYAENGNLIMKAKQTSDQYLSAEIRTSNSIWYKYGFVEISAKFDVSKGIATAFWLLGFAGQQFHGEIDVFECFGTPTTVKATPHSWVDGSNTEDVSGMYYCGAMKSPYDESYFTLPEGDSFGDEYHTFGIEWDETTIKWTYDGRVFFAMNTTFDSRSQQTFNGAMQMILTIYGGCNIGYLTGFPDETTDWSKNHMAVDYLRLYQLPGQELIRK